jgi:hypothetical protein
MPDKTDEQVVDEMARLFEYGLRLGRVYEDLKYRGYLIEEADQKADDIRERVRLYNNLIGQKV